MSPDVLVVIPARFGAERLPGKPLLRETGKYLVQHVWERAREARCGARVVLATDDPRILEAAEGFGAEAVLTAKTHRSGTDRVAEVARLSKEPLVVNFQGDEPELPGTVVDEVVRLLREPDVGMSTVAAPLSDASDMPNPSVVKVVTDGAGFALYFSRAGIPYPRRTGDGAAVPRRHVGIYGFRREALFRFVAWPPAPLEVSESLEQLRALANGLRIRVGDTAHPGGGIDTPEDYNRFVQRECARARGGET